MPKPAPVRETQPPPQDIGFDREEMVLSRSERGSVVAEKPMTVAELQAKTNLAAIIGAGRPSKLGKKKAEQITQSA